MRILKYSALILSLIVFGTNKSQEYGYASRCQGKQDCLENPACLCYCSGICDYREKTPEDNPVYIQNDPYGHFCYCKQWDIDVYEQKNCAIRDENKFFPRERVGGVKGF